MLSLCPLLQHIFDLILGHWKVLDSFRLHSLAFGFEFLDLLLFLVGDVLVLKMDPILMPDLLPFAYYGEESCHGEVNFD